MHSGILRLMRTASQEEGRVRQKRRMRVLLLRVAAELVAQGRAPSVTEVADAADVSRRTAYRYFPTQEQLLTEVSLEHLRPQVEAALKAAARRRSPAEVLDVAVTSMQRIAIEHDALLRTIVRLSLEKRLGGQQTGIPKLLPVRGSRRVEWIETALTPVRPLLTASLFERLVSGLTLCLGIESLITLQDVRTLSPNQAVEICRWAAQGMLEAALREQSEAGSKNGRSRSRRQSAVTRR
jgi:AcrR family transcriptional regulator